MGGSNPNTETDTRVLLYTSSAHLKHYQFRFEEVKSEVEIQIRDSESCSLDCSTYLQRRDFLSFSIYKHLVITQFLWSNKRTAENLRSVYIHFYHGAMQGSSTSTFANQILVIRCFYALIPFQKSEKENKPCQKQPTDNSAIVKSKVLTLFLRSSDRNTGLQLQPLPAVL